MCANDASSGVPGFGQPTTTCCLTPSQRLLKVAEMLEHLSDKAASRERPGSDYYLPATKEAHLLAGLSGDILRVITDVEGGEPFSAHSPPAAESWRRTREEPEKTEPTDADAPELIRIANGLETVALCLNSEVAPGHVNYVSKAEAAGKLLHYARCLRACHSAEQGS